jgi:thiol-disulfide isomerase/thioredoxin
MKRFAFFIAFALACANAAFTQGSGTISGAGVEGGAGAMTDSDSMAPGGKVAFTDIETALELAEKGPTVLFFAANWCPTCRTALKDLDENIDRLADITVVVVDYDKAASLKKTYRVTYQHTYVQIDAKGETLAAWNGGGVDTIFSRIVREEVY